jgi:uncharacterized protein YuzE
MTGQEITLTVDDDVGAAYVRCSGEPVAQTVELNPDVQVDIDSTGLVVGVEALNLDADFPVTELVSRFHFRSGHIEALSRVQPSIAAFAASGGSSVTVSLT